MFPSFDIGNLTIPLYSVMIAIGICVGAFVAYITIYKKENISKYTAIRLVMCATASGICLYIGAWIFNSIFHSIEERRLVFGGITWLGGVVVGFPVMILLIHFFVPIAKGRALYTFSLIVPCIVIGHGFGRIGCFFAGCCYGMETNSFLGVTFPGMDHKVLPTQLFEASFEFLLFAFMMLTRKKLKGHHLEVYFIAYGIFRFIIEFFRGDSRGSTGFFLSPAQFLDILIIIAAVFIILFYKQKVFKKLYAKCVIWASEARKTGSRKRSVFEPGQTPQDVIKELFAMKENGIITDEEYEKKKEKLLNKI